MQIKWADWKRLSEHRSTESLILLWLHEPILEFKLTFPGFQTVQDSTVGREGGRLSTGLVVKWFGENYLQLKAAKTWKIVVHYSRNKLLLSPVISSGKDAGFVDTSIWVLYWRVNQTGPPMVSLCTRGPRAPALLLCCSGHTEEKGCLGFDLCTV